MTRRDIVKLLSVMAMSGGAHGAVRAVTDSPTTNRAGAASVAKTSGRADT
jgi:hypothetical protein